MQLVARRVFEGFGGHYSILQIEHRSFWIVEREWNGNRRNISCVPRGTYSLVPHHGSKYPYTWALDGLTVSPIRNAHPDRARYACVIHAANSPSDLEGCLAPARGITAAGEAIDSTEATTELLGLLASGERHDLLLI